MAWAWRIGENLSSQIISNGTYAVDTYFVLSGFLYSFLFHEYTLKQKQQEKKVTKFSFGFFINQMTHRFVRYKKKFF